ncbi:MAG: DUF1553 domain-containing protein [Planctomycetaceae bacterium]
MNTFKTMAILTLVLAFLSATATKSVAADDALSFNQDIRPILSDFCYACHGPDANHREADLRLDIRDAAVEHGAIVPESPDESSLVERIMSDDPELAMPPHKGNNKRLSAEQKQKLAEWIRQGAVYQKHWSFEPVPQSVAFPDAGKGWARNEIDRFVARTLENKRLTPNAEVDRATWLRRVSFDLTGLPPSLESLDLFLADASLQAYEKAVDRLLESKAYGERMANMWLDVARYADTFGYQNDVAMEVWPWRDWVIGAFNANMPYDRFITEQIAGDMLPDASQNQRLATAFNRLHRQTNEGGSIPEEFRLMGIADRTTTTGTAFLGLTFECCQCHDHKFDPITTRDFYRLSAYFSDIDEFGLYSHFTFAQPTPATLLYEGEQRQQHEAALAAVKQEELRCADVVAAARKHWQQHRDALITELPEMREAVLHMPLDGEKDGVVGGATLCDGDNEIACDGAPEFGRTSTFSFSLWVKPATHQPRMLVLHQSVAAEDSGFRGLQLTIDDGHPEFSMIHFWPGNAVRIQSQKTIPVDQWTQVTVTHDGSGKAAGLALFINGSAAQVDIERDGLTRDCRHRQEWGDMNVGKVKLALGARFRDVGFRDGLVDDLHVFDVKLSGAEVAALYDSAGRSDAALSSDESIITDELAIEHQLLTADESVATARAKLNQVRVAEDNLVTNIRQIMVMKHFDDAPPTYILGRGEYTNKGEEVSAGTPEFLSTIPTDGRDRLALARWITHPDNPLTSRVIANRMWHLFFGRGIVVTLEDFGSQGSPPSHPELLDYLARSLIDDHWDLHALCRRIVLSATYRQTSTVEDADAYQRDPQNVWLSRGPRHRLSAEQLRDAALLASGLLVPTIGGPSVMPYQPEGLWEEAGTGKHYHQATGDGLYRRSMYTFWKRTAPPPSMLTFDATSRESCTPRRELTTTPLQALVFLNDPQYIEASRVLAGKHLSSHGYQLEARWDELFRRLISRSPTDQEREVVGRLYAEQLRYYQENEGQAAEFLKVGTQPIDDKINQADLAATAVVVQTIIAYDETIMLR